MQAVQPITLTGQLVRLEPLSLAHVPALAEAGAAPEIWRWMPYGAVTDETTMRAWVTEILARQARGTDLVFAVIHQEHGRAIGSTRYMDIQPAHDALEIGGTWYGLDYQRTGVNTECKRLLLAHAFETLGVHRVQLKTDLRNERSQRAIERLGAVREGVVREHMRMPDGYRRSSVYYSILASDWPAVRQRL
jgi:RimJ/RimL family protein N-acetyltransferase